MRLQHLAFFFIICTHVSAQNRDTAKLVLHTGYCRPMPYSNPAEPDSVLFFRQPDDKLMAKILMRRQRRFPIELSIPKGDYRVVYPNIYGETVDKKYAFNEDTATDLTLCSDSLVAYPENTLSKLKEKERLTIIYQSIGCFNNSHETLTIIRTKGRLEARLVADTTEYYLKGDSIHYRPKRNVLVNRKRLTSADSLAFLDFENALRKSHGHGCTNSDYYSIKSKYWNLLQVDGGCRWWGFYALKISLFGPPDPNQTTIFSSGRRAHR